MRPLPSVADVLGTGTVVVCRLYLPPHPRAGKSDILIDRLPGTPDGVSRAPDGSFWVSLIADIPGFTKWFSLPLVRGVLGHIPGEQAIHMHTATANRASTHACHSHTSERGGEPCALATWPANRSGASGW